MADAVSAFSTYKSIATKAGGGAKKNNGRANGKKNGSSAGKANAKKNSSGAGKAKAAKAGAKAATNGKPSGPKTSAIAAKLTNGATTSKPAAPKNNTKTSQAKGRKSGAKDKADSGINVSQIDVLVEQLLGGSPSKKLSKAEQKQKQQLEEYLVRHLEQDDDNSENGEGEGDDSTDSSFDDFSDEYTASGTDSHTTESSSENADGTEASSSDESVNGMPFDIQTIMKSKKSGQKRSSSDVLAAIANGISDSKLTKKSDEAKSSSRKSLPAIIKADKPTEPKRRSIVTNSTFSTELSGCSRKVDGIVKLEPYSPPANIVKMNSILEGEKVFRWLLKPVAVEEFFKSYWEKNACLVKRHQGKASYYSHLISFEAIDQMLLKHHVEFTKNIDVTSYKNGKRETLNPEGRAMPPMVWDHYGQGCSIRLLNPQTFIPALFTLNSTLQEYFHCLVGANAYLTPPNSQGFAPHYDDIEAFVLQIEGRKRWKLYQSRNQFEVLPRESSRNFNQNEIGEPILEEVLEPGDMLYFPRGTIHQACTEPGYHSLHITLSVYQKQSYADLFERMLPIILQRTIESNVDMRRGLPIQAFRNAGVAFSNIDSKERADMLQTCSQFLKKCVKDISLGSVMDAAVDQVAKKFQHEALPPEILPSEYSRTVFGSRSHTNENGECVCDYDIGLRTNIRLLRANILRLVREEDKIRIYYYLDNSKEYCEYEPNFMEIEAVEAGSIEILMKVYPEYIGVSQLPLADEERQIQLATALWERGLLMMEKPFK